MKARADGGPEDRDYKNLRDGCPVQERKARKQHRLAEVREGPCGIPELKQFQASLPEYQIKVVSIDPPHMLTFVGTPAMPSGKIIRLIKADGHYDGCSSFGGFLNKSYFCDDFNQGYNHDDYHHHLCTGKRCTACKRLDCSDFVDAKRTLAGGRLTTSTSVCHTSPQILGLLAVKCTSSTPRCNVEAIVVPRPTYADVESVAFVRF